MCNFHFIFVTDIDRSNPYNCQRIVGIRNLHQLMSTGQHKPLLIQAREKSCFCVDCVEDNPMSQCENVANGYVSRWDMKELI